MGVEGEKGQRGNGFQQKVDGKMSREGRKGKRGSGGERQRREGDAESWQTGDDAEGRGREGGEAVGEGQCGE